MSHFLAAVFVGVVVVDVYALATRVLPDRVGSYDPTATYRLAAPLGYWNGLGIFSVIALFLGLGFVARARSLAVRTLAGLTLPLLLATLYFTFSRGSWLAFGLAAVVVLAYDRRRLQLLATVVPALMPAVAAVLLASRSHALTTQGAATAAVTHAGHTLAWRIAGLSIAAAALGLAAGAVERRLTIGARVRTSIGAALALGAVVAVAGALLAAGGPAHVVRKAWHSFTAAPVQVGTGGELNKRLFSLSSNGRIGLWRAAWHEAKANPVLGGGSGSYEEWWLAHRTSPLEVQNAHNLYAETLAELGPFGLALLLVGLAVPLAAAPTARRHRLASFALGGYAAFLIHAAADWDWQLPAVVVPALACGCALLAAAGFERAAVRIQPVARVFATLLAAALLCGTFVVLVGNLELGRATGAADAGNWQRSAHYARVAARWMPWSSEPWQVVGEAELARREFPAARSDLRKALRRDPQNWQLWYDLAAASSGRAARAELARAKALNPLSPEIAQGL